MTKTKTHIYFVPDLAAGKEIFENISIHESTYSIHVLEWMIPQKKESLIVYAKRMAMLVIHLNSVLIGISFGDVVAREMSLFLKLKKLIIISSIKTKNELPKKQQIASKTKAYKIIPIGFLFSKKDLTKYTIGSKTKKKLALYQKYLSVSDKGYLDWAIAQMLNWDREKQVPHVIHIHGDNDLVFPLKNIKDCIVLPEGSHIMIINKYEWLNKNLPKIIEDDY